MSSRNLKETSEKEKENSSFLLTETCSKEEKTQTLIVKCFPTRLLTCDCYLMLLCNTGFIPTQACWLNPRSVFGCCFCHNRPSQLSFISASFVGFLPVWVFLHLFAGFSNSRPLRLCLLSSEGCPLIGCVRRYLKRRSCLIGGCRQD